MSAPAPPKRATADEARALQDESRAWPRYECIDGELFVTSAPRPAHYYVQLAIHDRVQVYVLLAGVGRAYMSPSDVTLEPDTTVQPDVFVVPGSPGSRLREWSDIGRLLLAVEVLSPSSARRDRLVKRRYFARNAVPEYWIADPATRLVERCFPDGRAEVLGDDLVWHPEGAAEPLVLDLRALFAEALGEDDAPPDPAAPNAPPGSP